MTQTTDPTEDPARRDRSDTGPSGGAGGLLGRVPRLGVWAWSFVGVVLASIIVFTALATVSEIALPMTFAAVLAVIFKPLVDTLRRRGVKPSLAAGLVVLGLLALMAGVVVATVRGVVDQAQDHRCVDRRRAGRAGGSDRRARHRRGGPGRGSGGRRGRRPDDHHWGSRRVGLGHRRRGGDRRRRDPRRPDHVLPAQGRLPPAPIPRRPGRRLLPGRRRRLPRRCLSHPARLREGPHRHVRRRGRGRRARRAPARPAARVHHHGGELHRRLHPLHRGLPRWRAGRDRRPRRGRAPRGGSDARRGARRQPGARELRRTQGHGPHARRPPPRRARRHRARRPPRRHRRPHPGRARLRDRRAMPLPACAPEASSSWSPNEPSPR